MLRSRFRTGLFVSAFAAAGGSAADPRPAPRRPAPAAPASPAAPTVLDVVAPAYRDAVAAVVRQPTLTGKATEDEFTAHAQVYDWLLSHPDRTSLAWRRLGVPCVPIERADGGGFAWADPNGSELAWRQVGRFADGVIWYASGSVKPGALMPAVPVRAVAVLHAPRKPADDGIAHLKPSVSVYLLTDSRAASAVLRMIGPAAPRMAEQGAEQLLLFFSGIASRLYQHPERMEELLAPPK